MADPGLAASSYDLVPYAAYPRPATHPDRLATVAHLHGLRSAPAERCRILELGCADGGNLVPIAHAFPASEIVGIDASARQIADGRAWAADLGLGNLRLEHGDLRALPADLGVFDYVLCHGVFSWVGKEVQEALLAACRRHLAPAGVAYISYNAYPGWHRFAMLREMILHHTRHAATPAEALRRLRELLGWLARHVPAEEAAHQAFVRKAEERLAGLSDAYLFHEYLETVNEPVYFHEFAARASGHGLQFLAETALDAVFPQALPPAIQAALAGFPDPIEREQYLDYLFNRTFRESLLCHAQVELDRRLEPRRLHELHVSSRAEPETPEVDLAPGLEIGFRAGDSRVATAEPIAKAALLELHQRWPEAVGFESLATAALDRVGDPAPGAEDARAELAPFLVSCLGAGVVRLHRSPPRAVARVSDRPLGSPLARRQSERGPEVATLHHEIVRLDPGAWGFLRCLDGNRDRAAVVAAVLALVRDGTLALAGPIQPIADPEPVRRALDQAYDRSLRQLARHALLAG